MKKAFLVAFGFAISVLPATAQTLKGTLFLGTSVGTTTYSQTSNDYTYPDGGTKNTDAHAYSLTLSPSMGIFVTNHLILGGSLGVSDTHNKTTTSNTETNPSTALAITNGLTVNLGPFLRYYFYETVPLKTMLYMQVQGTAGLGAGSSSGSGAGTTSNYTSSGSVDNIFTWTSGASLGVTHFFAKNIGIDFALGYAHNYESSNNTNSTLTNENNGNQTTKPNNYTLKTNTDGFTASVGFHWFIHPRERK